MLVSLEGNIGCGKSTLLEALRTTTFNKPHIIVQEDVKGWVSFTDSDNKSILEYFYEDKKSFSFCFQTLVLISRIHHLIQAIKNHPDHIIITERSHLTDFKIFVETLLENKEITEIEYLTYTKCHSLLNELMSIKVDAIIYNYTSPQVCIERIKRRNRKGESAIPDSYIKQLHEKHNDWLILQPNILVIDGNVDEKNIEQRLAQIQKIVTYINDL